MLGDSLTSGHGIGEARAFPAVLQQLIDDKGYAFRVVNAGISGDTSAGGVRRFQSAITGDVRVLVVALGVNDGLRGLPIAQIRANLNRIISEARVQGIAVVLCAMEALPLYGWDYTTGFRQMYRELADKHQVPLVPFMLADVIGDPAMMQPDRLHPNANGARAMARHLWPYLEAVLQSLPTRD